MSAASLGLVLGAAVLHALWNLAAKQVSGNAVVFVWMYAGLSGLLLLPVVIVSVLRADGPALGLLLLGGSVSAIVHLAYSVLLQTGYRQADLGVVYPVARGVGPALTILVAVLVLGERPSGLALAGAAVILTGVLIVAGRSLLRAGNGSRLRLGLVYGGLTGVAIAGYTLWDNHAVTELGLPPAAYFGATAALQGLLMTVPVWRRRAEIAETWRASWRQVIVVAVLSPVAYILVLIAMQTTSVALVAPVRESSIVIGALLGWWFLREPDPVRRVCGAVVVAVGITLVAIG